MKSSRRRRRSALLIACVAWFALGLQFYVMVRGVYVRGVPLAPEVVRFFSYFTILTNLLVAMVATGAGLVADWRRPALEAATAVYIVVVGVIYSLLLRHLYSLAGMARLADTLVHDVVPLLFPLWWVLTAKAKLAWHCVGLFLIWPLVYLALTLAMGASTGWYPYPFVNAQALGYPKVMITTAVLTVFLALLSALAVAYSRWRAGNLPAAS